ANVTAITHFLVTIAVPLGLLVSFRYKRFRPLEAGLLLVLFVIWNVYHGCPLTVLEQYLRDKAGQHVDIESVGFNPYYLNKFFGISVKGATLRQYTYYTSATFFGASIEWFKPFFHKEIIVFRKKAKRIRKMV